MGSQFQQDITLLNQKSITTRSLHSLATRTDAKTFANDSSVAVAFLPCHMEILIAQMIMYLVDQPQG